MSAITRSWLAFAAIGTGLIHVALVLGAPLPLGIVLAVLGVVEFAWGVLTFARERVPVPRAALVVALLPIVGWGLVLTIATIAGSPQFASSIAFLPLVIATVLELGAAALLARASRAESAPRAPGVARYVIGLAAGALVVAGLTTPALAATQAGLSAQPHGVVDEEPAPLELPGHPSH